MKARQTKVGGLFEFEPLRLATMKREVEQGRGYKAFASITTFEPLLGPTNPAFSHPKDS